MGDLAVINFDVFEDFLGDGDSSQMIDLFVEQAEEYLEELRASYMHGSAQEWHDVAHKFKGMASFAGTELLWQACANAQKNYEVDHESKGMLLYEIENEVNKAIAFFKEVGVR